MPIRLYTIGDLIPVLRMQKRPIRKLITSGVLPGKRVGRQFLVSEEALCRYLNIPEITDYGTYRKQISNCP